MVSVPEGGEMEAGGGVVRPKYMEAFVSMDAATTGGTLVTGRVQEEVEHEEEVELRCF